jgi:hypothetical protein
MAVDLAINITDGAALSSERDMKTGTVRESGTKVAHVYGVSGDNALSQAMAVVAACVPVFTPYSPTHPMCLCRGHAARGFAEDSGAAVIEIQYDSSLFDGGGGGGGQGTPWTVTDETRAERVETQLDPQSKAPLWLTWVDPKNSRNKISRIVTISFIQKVQRLVFSAVLPWAKVDELKAASPGVNVRKFLGLPEGYWSLSEVTDVAVVGSAFASVTAVLETRTTEDWSEYTLTRDPSTGIYYADTNAAKNIAKLPYKFGVRAANGILRSGPFPTVDLAKVFGITSLARVRKKAQ